MQVTPNNLNFFDHMGLNWMFNPHQHKPFIQPWNIERQFLTSHPGVTSYRGKLKKKNEKVIWGGGVNICMEVHYKTL